MENSSNQLRNISNRTNGSATKAKITPISDAVMDIDAVKTEKGFKELKSDWDELVSNPEVKAHIFQTFDWQYLWWKYFGGDCELHILVVRKNKKLVGIAPFFIDSVSLFGLYEYRTMKLVGSSIPNNDATGGFTSYSISDYLDVIIHPEYSDKVVSTLINYLDNSRQKVDRIDLDELPENGTFIEECLPKIQQHGWKLKKKSKEICPQIQLPGSIEKYLDELDRKARYELRYSKRAVTEKDLFKVYEVKDQSELESAFDHFVSIHQKRWNRRGYPGIFANSGFQNFLREVGSAFLEKDMLKMSTAVDNNENCIAVDFAFRFKDRAYDYQKAFDDETDLAKYSPGRALTYFLIEDTVNNGSEFVDLLRGGEKYKLRFANHKTQNWQVRIPGFAQKNRLKSSLYNLVQNLGSFKESLQRELLLIKVHIKQWGIGGFIPKYTGFLKERIEEKF